VAHAPQGFVCDSHARGPAFASAPDSAMRSLSGCTSRLYPRHWISRPQGCFISAMVPTIPFNGSRHAETQASRVSPITGTSRPSSPN
jgi:hypothetical protein